jgi:nitroreductase
VSNPMIDCLLNHRSIRRSKPDPIPDDTIELILQAGTRAANAGNLQTYSFVVLADPAFVKKLGFRLSED